MTRLNELEATIGYEFKTKSLLNEALTHQSYANDNKTESYERLEFLGDAIIELVVSDFIYNNFNFEVGVLTRLRASLVSTDYLVGVSKELKLDELALKSKSLSQLGKKNIADLFESLVGAIYVDGGLLEAKKLIEKFVIKSLDNIRFVLRNHIDYKSKFQEYMQSLAKIFEYKIIASTGLDHNKQHTVGLWVEGEKITEVTASNKQVAEEKCAEFYIKNCTDLSANFE